LFFVFILINNLQLLFTVNNRNGIIKRLGKIKKPERGQQQ